MPCTIRELTEGDWESVSRIYKEGMDTNVATFQYECPSFEEWDAAHLKVCRLAAEKDGRVVGFAVLSAYSKRPVYAGVAEVSIYIGADSRGEGVGRALLTELVRVSEGNGFWTLQSGVMEDNERSRRLHRDCGFREVGLRERIGRDRFGVWRSTVLMERRSADARFS